MKSLLVCIGFATFVHSITWGDPAPQPSPEVSPQIIQDPSTKITYYIESDRRHVAAISPAGKLLWCAEVLSHPRNDLEKTDHVDWIANRDKDSLLVSVQMGLGTSATIDKATGVVKFSGHVP